MQPLRQKNASLVYHPRHHHQSLTDRLLANLLLQKTVLFTSDTMTFSTPEPLILIQYTICMAQPDESA